MNSVVDGFAPFAEKMRAAKLPDIVINIFRYYYRLLEAGHTGLISEEEITPLDSLPDMEALPAKYSNAGRAALDKTILLKLNGGLGTSMGLEKAKSLLQVKNGLAFLDIIARQALRRNVPLVLMNSFNTREDSLALLMQYPKLVQQTIPLDFLQHKVPKINQTDLSPAEYPVDPEHEWAPPGHGDIYAALVTSGLLEKLLDEGYEYAFISNADNLGAVLDLHILGYFAENGFPFMMEAADRTEADKKGGHLAHRPDSRLILRESAQVPEDEMSDFQNISRHRYFNTNNIWINLRDLNSVLRERDNILGLPMIRNRKTVNPRDSQSTPVYQLETAMGTAIEVFAGAAALRVPRTRFIPVKTTADLLAVRSDAYILTEQEQIIPHPERSLGQIVIDLDNSFYKLIDQMEKRFPYGVPSLMDCAHLTIEGDVTFGRNVRLCGDLRLKNNGEEPMYIPDELTIEGQC